MGCYINPPDCTKEQWLADHAMPILGPSQPTDETVPICLVDNGCFTAAGVCYDSAEVFVFAEPLDRRPKQWYRASREEVRKVSDLALFEEHA